MDSETIRAKLTTPALLAAFDSFDIVTQSIVLNYEQLARGHLTPLVDQFVKSKGNKGKDALIAHCTTLNARLTNRTYLTTERATGADVAVFASLAKLIDYSSTVDHLPHFVRWFNTLGVKLGPKYTLVYQKRHVRSDTNTLSLILNL